MTTLSYGDVNGTRLAWRTAGDAQRPLVFLHGSWQDSHSWDLVLPRLAQTHRVIAPDRRGHGQSSPNPGGVHDDVADLARLIEHLDLAPAVIVANSSGASIALRLAIDRPDLCDAVIGHEPPLLGLLEDASESQAALAGVRLELDAVRTLLAESRFDDAAEWFVERVALGPGAWRLLPPAARQRFIAHAPTFADELLDPEIERLSPAALADCRVPIVLTAGAKSPAFFRAVIDRLTGAHPGIPLHVFQAAGHAPHATHPGEFVQFVNDAIMRLDQA